MATEYKNIETIFAKVLDNENTIVSMKEIKSLFQQATEKVSQYFGDLQRAKLHYFPYVLKFYELNKKSKDNPKGIETTKYLFIGDILSLQETQVKVYNKAYQIQVQFPTEDFSQPIDSIVREYETVKVDGKSNKLDNGMYEYQKKQSATVETDENGEPIQLSNSEILQKQIDAKKAAIVKAKNRVATLETELVQLENDLQNEKDAIKRYQDAVKKQRPDKVKAEPKQQLQTI